MKLKEKVLAILVTSSALSPLIAAAQNFPGGKIPESGTNAPKTINQVFDKIVQIFGYFQVLFFLLAAFFILFAGYQYLSSGGDETKVAAAKNNLLYAVVAIVVALLATAVGPLVKSIIGA